MCATSAVAGSASSCITTAPPRLVAREAQCQPVPQPFETDDMSHRKVGDRGSDLDRAPCRPFGVPSMTGGSRRQQAASSSAAGGGRAARSCPFVRVEVESPVRAFLECSCEGVAAGEADGGCRLVDERFVVIARRAEAGGDAAAGEHGVGGERRGGAAGIRLLVATCPGFCWRCRRRPGRVAGGGEPHDQCRSTGAVVVEGELVQPVSGVGGAERPACGQGSHAGHQGSRRHGLGFQPERFQRRVVLASSGCGEEPG